jgi:hypothetical protein
MILLVLALIRMLKFDQERENTRNPKWDRAAVDSVAGQGASSIDFLMVTFCQCCLNYAMEASSEV